MRWLLGIVINAVLFVALAGWFQGFHVSGFGAAFVASLILSILNMLVRPILIILTLPITILTLGLFLIVINAMTLLLTDAIMGDAFDVSSFGLALLVVIIMSIFNLVVQRVLFEKD
ncbi:phage holin family protein [Bacillus smithii]|jgi:putative membrane protein|uniref:phage holin family protein n=1 Tax=Bacillus smithii TaxID=1479 RepID=UPI002E212BC9|nr:phage holin family protein [Bacillus smithii]MED1454794.1 phage holin family protein [Bacillus smithii]